jgi:tape measure domain-containing protein
MAKTTTELQLKVTADSRAAARGLAPLESSLKDIQEISEDAEKALKELGDKHRVDIDDDEVDRLQTEIKRLREQMRDDFRMDVNADTRVAQRRIRELQSAARLLDTKDVDIDVDIDTTAALAGMGARMAAAGTVMGTVLGTATSAAFSVALAAGTAVAVTGLAVGGGLGLAGLQALKLSDRMAQAKIAFTQFLGTEKQANRFLANLQQFAAKTPFEFPELVESSKTLLAFGVGSDEIVGLLTTLGDAAALTGAEVGNLTTIWGQMEAKGKVSNEELLQLTENGIPAYKLLADSMGKTVPEIQEMAEKGQLLSDDVLPGLKAKMDAAFGGGMAKQAETLGGKFSTLKDNLSAFGTEVGNALAPAADAIIDDLQPALEDVSQWAKENKGVIVLSLTEGLATFLDLGATVLNVIASIIDAQETIQNLVGDFLIKMGLGLSALAGLPGIPDSWGEGLINAGQGMKDSADGLAILTDGMHSTADAMHSKADDIRESGREIAKGFEDDEVKAKIDRIQDHIAKLKKKPPSAKVDANIDAAEDRIKRLNGRLRRINREKTATTIDAKIDKAKSKVDEIKGSLKYLRKQKPTPEIKAKIDHWKKRLGIVKGDLNELKDRKVDAQVEPKTDKNANAQTKNTLEDTANPGGKGRNAPIKPKVDPTSKETANTTLTNLSADRTMYIDVFYRTHGGPPGGPGGGGPPGGPGTPTPSASLLATGPDAGLMAAGRGVTAAPSSAPVFGRVQVDRRTAEVPRRLAPKQTPVMVLLDGKEISTHLELRAQRMATVGSTRRRA